MTLEVFLATLANVIVNPLIRLLFAVALVVFLWGVFEYIKDSDSSDGREKGKKHIIWGIIGLLIMVSAYSIINIALETFGLNEGVIYTGEL